ncbi:MAG: O-antigen ligase family protein [Ignavibacteriae bacterium]|nr:O-antigen ligase family protein [Ignavibacteriota bacterium]
MFFTVFLYNYQVFPLAGQYGVTSLDLITLLFYFYFIKRIIWNGEKLLIGWHTAIYFFFGLLAAVLLSGFTPLLNGSAPQVSQFIKTSIHIIFLGFFVFIALSFQIKTEIWTNVIKMWLILSIFINIFGIYQIPARAYDLPLAWLDFTNISMGVRGTIDVDLVKQLSLHYGDFFRATSIFPEPSALASFNVIIFSFLLIPYIQKTKSFFQSKILNVILFITTLTGLFLTFSMTGFIGIVLILTGIFLLESFKRLIPLIIVIFSSIIIIFLTDSIVTKFSGVSVAGLFQNRIEGIINYGSVKKEGMEGESIYGRVSTAERSINIWKEHPINGIGMGLISYDKKQGLKFNDFSSFTALAELGLIGFISFTGMFISLLIITSKYITNKKIFEYLEPNQKRLIGLLFYLLLHQVLINFITGNNLVRDSLWLPMGMIFSIINLTIIKQGGKIFTVQLVKTPLRTTFYGAINKHLAIEKEKKM